MPLKPIKKINMVIKQSNKLLPLGTVDIEIITYKDIQLPILIS